MFESGEDFVACRNCLLAVSKYVGERANSLSKSTDPIMRTPPS